MIKLISVKKLKETTQEILSKNEFDYFQWSHKHRENPDILPDQLIDISSIGDITPLDVYVANLNERE